jgi:glutamyl-tRNA synthetase
MRIRTRVAPSPTGDPHLGTAYVALINFAYAKSQGGEFILRIEDTDRKRSTLASEQMILRSLRWLGLAWDEGPDVGGANGPYRQSERGAIYKKYVDQLLESGHAFRCYCTEDRLTAMREAQRRTNVPPRYDGRCLNLSSSEIKEIEAAGTPSVVRMKVPAEGICTVHDMRRGTIDIAWSTVDMQVLTKSDGMPTYHLANVVDDHLMGITDVIRGEEWITSAPKHILLYQYFGWSMPRLAHLPLLRNADHSKLSKRKNPTSILYYERMGYLPEALVNFLGLLALSLSEGEEMHTLQQLVHKFHIDNITLGGPVFDSKKLDWLNSRYLRETMDAAGLLSRVEQWALNRSFLEPITALAQQRIERLSDLVPLTAFFFSGKLQLSLETLRDNKLDQLQQRKAYQLALWQLDQLPSWERTAIDETLRRVATQLDVKFRDLVRAFYIAVTGSATSVPLFDAMALLGRDICRERLRGALQTLGPVSSREADEWRSSSTGMDSGDETAA